MQARRSHTSSRGMEEGGGEENKLSPNPRRAQASRDGTSAGSSRRSEAKRSSAAHRAQQQHACKQQCCKRRRAARRRASHARSRCADGPTVPADSTTKGRRPEVTHKCVGTKLPYSRHLSRSWVWICGPSLPSGVSTKHLTSTCTSQASGLRKWMSAVRSGRLGAASPSSP